eukprot:scaffold222890_cov15-Tisochrysis_lutea.AAC.1
MNSAALHDAMASASILAELAEGLGAAGGHPVWEFPQEHAVDGEGVGGIKRGEAAEAVDGNLRGARRDGRPPRTCRRRRGRRRGRSLRRPRPRRR